MDLKNTIEIQEGLALIKTYPGEIKKSDTVFYNPEMRENRDISVLAIKAHHTLTGRTLRVIDAMSATGIRGIRYAKEAPESIEEIIFNDLNLEALKLIKENIKLNKITTKHLLYNLDAGEILHHYRFLGDVVDLDPFGSAAYYLEAVARATSNKGVAMITFTDTAPLSGTYPRTAKRRYGVVHQKNYFPKGEIALRVALKAIAEEFAKFDKGIVPLLSISHKHYIRVIVKVIKSKSSAEHTIDSLKYLHYNESQEKKFQEHYEEKSIGKVWSKSLGDEKFVEEMLKHYNAEIHATQTKTLLESLKKEYSVQGLYYEIPKLTKHLKTTSIGFEKIKSCIESKGYKIERAHFKDYVVITNAPYDELKNCLQ